MFGFRKQEPEVLVLHDALEIDHAVQLALGDADASERPGLQRAAAIIAEHRGVADSELRKEWVRRALTEAGMEPGTNSVAAVAAVRKAAPSLSLLTATQLVREAASEQ